MRGWFIFPFLCFAFEAQAFFFPEIPFCPLGGPPGWYNRMVDDDDYRYPPPPAWYDPRTAGGYYPPLYRQPPLPPRRDCASGFCPSR